MEVRELSCDWDPSLARLVLESPRKGFRGRRLLERVPTLIGGRHFSWNVLSPVRLATVLRGGEPAGIPFAALHRAVSFQKVVAEDSVQGRNGHGGDDDPADHMQSEGHSFRPHSSFVAQVGALVNGEAESRMP